MASRGDAAVAAAVARNYLRLRPGTAVTVETWSHALPLARALVAAVRARGARAVLLLEDEATFFRSLAAPGAGVPDAPPALAAIGSDYVYLPGPEAFPRLFALRGAELAAVRERHGAAWQAEARRRRLRAVRLAVPGATPTAAERYGVDVTAWRRELVAASGVPPAVLAAHGTALLRRLRAGRTLRLRHPNGTDLRVALRPRSAVVEDGRSAPAPGNRWIDVPTGVLRVPIAVGAGHGTWESNRPVYDRWSEPPVALGARFRFHSGRLREVALDRGGATFARAYARGGPGRGAPSALTFGLNPRVAHAPEVGELALGTVGLTLGNNLRAGGRNRARFSYWTGLTEAELEIDGRPWAPRGFRTP